MRRAITLSLIVILTFSGIVSQAVTIKGRVTAGSAPIAGVVVTDGKNFAVTGSSGRYTLEAADESRFVYLSLPAGYSAPLSEGVVKFFLPIEPQEGKRKSYDFYLEKREQDDSNHGFIVVADPQIYSAKEFKLLEEGVADIKNTVSGYKIPFHGIAPGDLISHDHKLYPEYNRVMAKSGIPFFNAMGNHDMVNAGRSFETTQWKYEQMFGPSYYSFNVGKIHYVVLNDCFYVGREFYYIGYLEERQLSWLERDLAYVPKGSTVVVALHIPTTISKKDRDKFSYEKAGTTMANHKGLYKILEPYNTHIISGHLHTNHNEVISANLFEHVTAAMSGAWWQGELCTDGTPKGYGVYIANGDTLSWYYKSTNRAKEHQMRLYTGEDNLAFKGYIVANIWNYDPSWRVELYEDGVLTSAMERFEGYDPMAGEIYSNKDKLEHKWIYPSLTDKLFRAKPKSETSEVIVVATDRFGNRYSEKLKSRTSYDVVIVGGGASGTSAGIRAASLGARTLIIEEFDWLGGMLTSSGVSAADGNHKLKGGIWGRFRDSLEIRYGGTQGLKTGWVSNTLFEPSVGAKIFANMAAKESNLTIWFRSTVSNISGNTGNTTGNITGSTTGNTSEIPSGYWRLSVEREGKRVNISAKVLIDATELGDIAKKVGVAYNIGMDSRLVTGEDIAPMQENDIIQDLTYVMVLKEYETDMTITKPQGYNPTLFYCSTISNRCKNPKEKQRLWSSQMMITYGKLPNKKYMINWPIEGNDYYTNILELTSEQRAIELEKAKQHSLSFLYYMQTELGYNKLALADDEFPTADKFPFIPYHRESRRIEGKVRFTINHISNPYSSKERLYRTAIGVGDYPVDHHHTRYEGWEALPDLHFYPVPSYGLPLGTLIPKEQEGLIVAEKSISVTNLVNGTTRLQPVVLQIGEAAGVMAALASAKGSQIAEVPVREVQTEILKGRGYLLPYLDLPVDHLHFKTLQRIGVTGIIKGIGLNKGWENQTWFYTDSLITNRELSAGLIEFYSEASGKELILSSKYGEDNFVTIESIAHFISSIEKSIGSSSTLSSLEGVESIERVGAESGLNNLKNNRALTRLECAVLIDKFLNPFDKFGIDFRGEILN